MENIFEVVVNKLLEVGFYDLLIFIIGLTLFYAILKRAKLFGESPLINGALSFGIAFLMFGFPILMHFSLVLPLATFFTQSFVFILVMFVGMLVASFFYPDLPKFLAEHFSSRSMLSIGVVIGVVVAILSGLSAVMWTTPPQEDNPRPAVPTETAIAAAGVVIFIVLIVIAGSIALRQ